MRKKHKRLSILPISKIISINILISLICIYSFIYLIHPNTNKTIRPDNCLLNIWLYHFTANVATGWGRRDVSANKNTYCSPKGPEFCSHKPFPAAHNHLQLQLRGIRCPRSVSVAAALTCAHPHAKMQVSNKTWELILKSHSEMFCDFKIWLRDILKYLLLGLGI